MSETIPAGVSWYRSRHSQQNGACVEAARLGSKVALRDSKDPDGPKIVIERGEWCVFLRDVKRGLD